MEEDMREKMESWIRSLQEEIVQSLENFDPTAPKSKRDSWTRAEGGSGQSCVFSAPAATNNTSAPPSEFVLEKAGVNISIVHGTLPPPAIKQMRADHASMPLPEDAPGGLPFFAAGISLVIHLRNPHAPTAHANYRYFEISDPSYSDSDSPKVLAWWFGGGADLTPSYLYPLLIQAAHIGVGISGSRLVKISASSVHFFLTRVSFFRVYKQLVPPM